MKRITAVFLVIMGCLGMLTGCGSYKADTSTVFVEKGGSIVSIDVESFDESIYDQKQLETYVKDAVNSYTSENGEDTVKFEKLEVEDQSAKLTLKYQSADDYTAFNKVELFNGTIAEALAKGFRFETQFASIENGKVEDPVESSEFLNDDNLKVVVIKGNLNVQVSGKVVYCSSENTSIVDKNTVSVQPGQNLFQELETENVSKETQQTEVEMTTEDSGSVGEEELLLEPETESEKIFDFGPEEKQTEQETNEFSNVYTYIVYK